jgi:hypothetical protein
MFIWGDWLYRGRLILRFQDIYKLACHHQPVHARRKKLQFQREKSQAFSPPKVYFKNQTPNLNFLERISAQRSGFRTRVSARWNQMQCLQCISVFDF